MSEPLFLQSVMQEKIWGGTHLRDVFGYDIPSDHVGEYWAISAHPNGVSTIKNGRYAGQTLDVLYAEHRELFGNRQEPVFPQFRSIQMMLMDLNMKVNLVKQSVGISLLLNQVLKLFMATMPNQKKNCVSKLKVRIGKIF